MNMHAIRISNLLLCARLLEKIYSSLLAHQSWQSKNFRIFNIRFTDILTYVRTPVHHDSRGDKLVLMSAITNMLSLCMIFQNKYLVSFPQLSLSITLRISLLNNVPSRSHRISCCFRSGFPPRCHGSSFIDQSVNVC
jgi:hypothetical protein